MSLIDRVERAYLDALKDPDCDHWAAGVATSIICGIKIGEVFKILKDLGY